MRRAVMENQIWSPSAVGPIASRHLRLFALNGTDDLGRDISKLLAHLSARMKSGILKTASTRRDRSIPLPAPTCLRDP